MDRAWSGYLSGAAVGFAGLETYAKLTGKPTLTQYLQRRCGVKPIRRLSYVTAPLGGALLVWLWVHLFTRYL